MWIPPISMFIRNSTFCFLPNNSEKALVLIYSALDALKSINRGCYLSNIPNSDSEICLYSPDNWGWIIPWRFLDQFCKLPNLALSMTRPVVRILVESVWFRTQTGTLKKQKSDLKLFNTSSLSQERINDSFCMWQDINHVFETMRTKKKPFSPQKGHCTF